MTDKKIPEDKTPEVGPAVTDKVITKKLPHGTRISGPKSLLDQIK